MVYVVPLTYTVRIPFKGHAHAYSTGDVLTTAQAQGLPLGVLVSSGRLVAAPDTSARRGHAELGPQPTYVVPDAVPRTSGTITATQAGAPGRFTFDASWNGLNTRWDFGDGHYENSDDTTEHIYLANGTYTVTATAHLVKATVSAVVTSILITSVTAGTPGYFSPSGATIPATLVALKANAVVGDSGSNKPTTAWTVGQYVVLGDASHAYWNGTAWAAGEVVGGMLFSAPTMAQQSATTTEAPAKRSAPKKTAAKTKAAPDKVEQEPGDPAP